MDIGPIRSAVDVDQLAAHSIAGQKAGIPPLRFVLMVFGFSGLAALGLLAIFHVFHERVVLPRYDGGGYHFRAALASPQKLKTVTMGSSLSNMSLHFPEEDFYNLAWRGENIANSLIKLRVLHRMGIDPKRLLVEVSYGVIGAPASPGRLFAYRPFLEQSDFDLLDQLGISSKLDWFSMVDSGYRRLLPGLLLKFLLGEDIKPEEKILQDGFSYNVIAPPQEFLDQLKDGSPNRDLHIDPNYLRVLTYILEYAQSNGIEVILLQTPFHPVWATPEMRIQMAQIDKELASLGERFGARYCNFFGFTSADEDFWNDGHMSLSGATKFSEGVKAKVLDDEPCES